jgi:hypothetical protein
MTRGRLTFRTRPEPDRGPIEHEGIAKLVRRQDGMLIFDLDMDGTPEIALYPDEVLAFIRLDAYSGRVRLGRGGLG